MINFYLVGFYGTSTLAGYLMPIPLYIGCLKIDATHLYDNNLLLRQLQWCLFGTCLVKNVFFEQEISN